MAATLEDLFSFQPLSELKEIRLVVFHHGERLGSSSSTGRISMGMITTSLEASPPYRAISYEWGTAEGMKMIEMEGKPHRIRRNLHEFLEILSESDDSRGYLWVDQLCINQSDFVERNSQVRRMDEIFAGADQVIAWIGAPANGSDGIMRTLKRVEQDYMPNFLSPKAEERFKASFWIDEVSWLHFQHRSYWRRLWIVQELALAKHVVAFCGRANCSGQVIVFTPRWLKLGFSDTFDPLYGDGRNKNLSLAEAIGRYIANECDDPRDKIFGLAAIIKESERPVINYSASPEKVLADACASLLETYMQKHMTCQIFDGTPAVQDKDLLRALKHLSLVAWHVNEHLYRTIWSIATWLEEEGQADRFAVSLRDLEPWRRQWGVLEHWILYVLSFLTWLVRDSS